MTSSDTTPFVFHDAAGRRWSRIKRIAFAIAAALVVLGGAVALAVTHVAPGRAPSFAASAPQQVPDWPVRGSGGDATPAPSDAAAAQGAGQPQATPSAAGQQAPGTSPRPAPTPTPEHTPRPRRPSPHILTVLP